MFRLILATIFCASLCHAEYTKLYFKECFATGNQVVKVSHVDVTPMPIQPPMDINFDFKATLTRQLRGKLRTNVTMYRILPTKPPLKLPIRCTIVDGVQMGSCNYDDLCEFMRTLSMKKEVNYVLGNLFKSFFGDEAPVCPIANSLEVNIPHKFTIPDLSKSAISLFMSGDYEVKINVVDGYSFVGCWDLGYTILPRLQ